MRIATPTMTLVALTLIGPPNVAAQTLAAASHGRHRQIVVPQRSTFAPQGTGLKITGVRVGSVIVDQSATTTMEISLLNPTSRRIEAELLVPVPNGAVVQGFAFEGSSSEPTARLLPIGQARKTYESIVRKMRDPALLEFAGLNSVRSSVFPVEPQGKQKVRLTFEHLLAADGNRVDFVLPRTESLDYDVPWRVSVRIRTNRPVSTVYSPSHLIETRRVNPKHVDVNLSPSAAREPGSFRLAYLHERSGVTMSMYAYPDPAVGGGYFLLLGGVPGAKKASKAIKREVTLVIDRSGSMHGDKLKQAKEAALQIIAGLGEGEAFNIIDYQSYAQKFADQSVLKTESSVRAARDYLKAMLPGGGTNIYDALVEALRAKPTKGTLPIVLFLTDGLPTIGETSEVKIRELVAKNNPHQRRVFTFGVGVDVNTPLLEAIALKTRAKATFVLPGEDVEVKVGGVFRRLSGPVLADPVLSVRDLEGAAAMGRVQDLIPHRLPDLFDGDQLVVLGRYVGDDPVQFVLRGNFRGKTRSFPTRFGFEKASTLHSFVPRLWASRRIALLIDEIRQMGASTPAFGPAPPPSPKLKELVDEIVRLSTKFGILTEYTAFFANEGTDLSKKSDVLAAATRLLSDRAMRCRTGVASVNQSLNNQMQLQQKSLKYRNDFLDARLSAVQISNVQQVNDCAFYRKGNTWIDSRLVDEESATSATMTIEFGSDQFVALVQRLTRQGRQGTISLRGDILMVVDGERVLVKAP